MTNLRQTPRFLYERISDGCGAGGFIATSNKFCMSIGNDANHLADDPIHKRHQRRLDGRARRITIDLDPTDDATHGAQQLTFFIPLGARGETPRRTESGEAPD